MSYCHIVYPDYDHDISPEQLILQFKVRLPRSPFCLITQGALRDETKTSAGWRVSVMPMITRGNLWFLSAIGNWWYNPFFIFCWLYFSTHSPMSKTSGMSQNIGVTSLTTLGVIQEPIGVIPKSATYSLYSVFFFFRVFQESQGKREASVERGKRPLFVP